MLSIGNCGRYVAIAFAGAMTVACGTDSHHAGARTVDGGESGGARGSHDADASSSGGAAARGGTGGSSAGGANTRSAGGSSAGGANTRSTGGSSAGGADGGDAGDTGGARPIVVGNCAKAGESGIWEDITPSDFRAMTNLETTSVAVDASHPSVVYATAGNKTNGGNGSTGVYRSTDCGATFHKVSTGQNGAKLDTGDVWQIIVDPSTGDVYATNGYGDGPTLYKSTNGGVDWTPLATDPAGVVDGPFVQSVAMDPKDGKHLVLTFHQNCKDGPQQLAPMCLSETKDGGATWREFKGPAQGWQEGAFPFIIDAHTFFYFSLDGGWYTADDGATWTKVLDYPAAWGAYRASNGVLFVGAPSVGLRTVRLDAPVTKDAFKLLPMSPPASGFADDGHTLILSWSGNTPSDTYYYTAPLDDPASGFTPTPARPQPKRGGLGMAYDSSHRIAYSNNWVGGLFRYRLP